SLRVGFGGGFVVRFSGGFAGGLIGSFVRGLVLGFTARIRTRGRGGGRFFVVTFGKKRRGQILTQHDEVEAAGHGVLVTGHVDTGGGQSGVGAGGEIEVFSALVEAGRLAVAHPVGDLRGFSGVQGVDKNSVQVIGQDPGVNDPLAVRRPFLRDVVFG